LSGDFAHGHLAYRGREWRFMAKPFRTLFKFIVGLLAAPPAAGIASEAEAGGPVSPTKAGNPVSPVQAETLTLSAFVARVRRDATLRARFAQDPRTVLRELGIDPTPYNLLDRLTDAQLDRLLADWSRDADWLRDAGAPSPPPEPLTAPVPNPVYGPPPGFRERP
jgi:hypothetical protein